MIISRDHRLTNHRIAIMFYLFVVIVIDAHQSQTGRRRQRSFGINVLVCRTDGIAVGGDHRLRGSNAHILHAVPMRQLVSMWHRPHHEATALNGVAEQVAIGLVIVAGLLVVRMTMMTVHRRLWHQLMWLLMLVNPVRIEVMRRSTWRPMLMLVLELWRLWNAVRRWKIGRLVVHRGSHWRIITEPESACCTRHCYVRGWCERIRTRGVM